MQFTIAMVAAHACVAVARRSSRLLDRLAGLPESGPSRAQAVSCWQALFSLVTAWLNWALVPGGLRALRPVLDAAGTRVDGCARVLVAACVHRPRHRLARGAVGFGTPHPGDAGEPAPRARVGAARWWTACIRSPRRSSTSFNLIYHGGDRNRGRTSPLRWPCIRKRNAVTLSARGDRAHSSVAQSLFPSRRRLPGRSRWTRSAVGFWLAAFLLAYPLGHSIVDARLRHAVGPSTRTTSRS